MYRKIVRNFSSYNKNAFKSIFAINEEVRHALEYRNPLVALESTIITHGMPFPDNVTCAKSVEDVVRQQGAVPATIAIVNGKIKVGLSQSELDMLGDTKYSLPIKTSRRDFPFVLNNKRNGGTTVAGTLIVADRVGIQIFATGGIGGVHRDVHETFDISADLTELGKSNVAVVCSGIKSILDIPRTLEYLETQGVFVATFGNTTDFPAFYARTSGCRSPYSIKDANEAAETIRSAEKLNMQTGILIAVPIPEEYAMDPQEMDEIIQKGLTKAKQNNISGKNITPYLLSFVSEMTNGKSLETNISLIKNNAKTAADIAVSLSRLEKGGQEMEDTGIPQGQPVIIGGSNLDWTVKLDTSEIKLDGRIHFGKFSYSGGGVARNICEALTKLGCQPIFFTAVGDDEQGKLLKSLIPKRSQHGLKVLKEHSTAQCVIILDKNGDCSFLVGDMSIHSKINAEMINQSEHVIKKSPLIILDGNLSGECITSVLFIAEKYNIPVIYEPTDVIVSSKPFKTSQWKSVKLITPNLNELHQIAKHFKIITTNGYTQKINEIANIAKDLAFHIDNVIVTLGSEGLLIARRGLATQTFLSKDKTDEIHIRYYPITKVKNFVNVSGAGDCLASGLIAALLAGLPEEKCVSVGFACATSALHSKSPVPEEIFDRSHESWKTASPYSRLKV